MSLMTILLLLRMIERPRLRTRPLMIPNRRRRHARLAQQVLDRRWSTRSKTAENF